MASNIFDLMPTCCCCWFFPFFFVVLIFALVISSSFYRSMCFFMTASIRRVCCHFFLSFACLLSFCTYILILPTVRFFRFCLEKLKFISGKRLQSNSAFAVNNNTLTPVQQQQHPTRRKKTQMVIQFPLGTIPCVSIQ